MPFDLDSKMEGVSHIMPRPPLGVTAMILPLSAKNMQSKAGNQQELFLFAHCICMAVCWEQGPKTACSLATKGMMWGQHCVRRRVKGLDRLVNKPHGYIGLYPANSRAELHTEPAPSACWACCDEDLVGQALPRRAWGPRNQTINHMGEVVIWSLECPSWNFPRRSCT